MRRVLIVSLCLCMPLLVGCDAGSEDGLEDAPVNVSVEVAGVDSYAFSEPAMAQLAPAASGATEVLSIRLSEEADGRRISLQLDLEVTDLVADSTYVLYSVISRSHIGDGEPSMWARFFDCPVNQIGFCERDYYAISGEATLFFIQITRLTETRVAGTFGFVGLTTANPRASLRVGGTFSLPLEQ